MMPRFDNAALVRVLLLAVLAVVTACSDGGNGNKNKNRVDTLSVTTYNMGLALNFVPYTAERLVANEMLLGDYEGDVICFQEVWLDEYVQAIETALKPNYPYLYTVEPEQVFSGQPACTSEEIAGFAACVTEQCPGLSGSELVACGPAQCGAFIPDLSPACFEGVIAGVGIPDITVDALVELVTQPAGKFAYDGALGLLLASKYELRNRQFQDFIEDSSGNHRGALYAEIDVNDQPYVLGCTHPTANLAATIPYPGTGKHGSWEGENRFMQQQMITYVNKLAGNNPILFAGDFNCSVANPANGVDGEFADNCELWLRNGFADPAAEQLPCTFCSGENLILQSEGGSDNLLLDHIFVKNVVTRKPISAQRVFDDPVSIEATIPPSELQPEQSPAMTHPSDHFGVELELQPR